MIQNIIHDQIEDAQAVRCNVRAMAHNTTTSGAGTDPLTGRKLVRIDPLGYHITFEIQNPKTLMWQTYHSYVTWIRKNGRRRLVKNHNVSPNPQLYPPSVTSNAAELDKYPEHPDFVEHYNY